MTLLFNSALRSSFIVVAAWGAARVLASAPADLRRWIWLAAVCAIACLPVVVGLAFRVAPSSIQIGVPLAAERLATADLQPGLAWTAIVWAAGAVLVLGRLVLGLLTVWRLDRGATLRDGVLYADQLGTPVMWGVSRPTVMLPSYTKDWSADRRALLIRHEQAHIEHHDWLWQMLAQTVCAVFWFHPLVWLAARELARESERAADDCVLGTGADAHVYATQLLEVARSVRGSAPSAALAIIGRLPLERRVAEILDAARCRTAVRLRTRVAVMVSVAAVVMASSVPLAAMQSRSVYKVGDDGVTPPAVLSKVRAYYTTEAMKRHIQGSVLLAAEISEKGEPENIVVTTSLDPGGLDDNAVKALEGWRFEPGLKDGRPVRVEVDIDMEFVLR